MPHARPLLQPAQNALLLHGTAQAQRILQKNLVVAHLNQRGRKGGKIAVQGRIFPLGPVRPGGVGLPHRADVVFGEHGVGLAPGFIGLAGGGHVRPGGEQHQLARQPAALGPQPHHQLQRHVAAGGIARQHHIRRAPALMHQVVPGLFRVLQRRRVGVLRGQPVLEGQHRAAGALGQLCRQRPGVAQIAGGVAAAVAVQNDFAGVFPLLGAHPCGGHAADFKGLPAHAQHGGDHAAQQLLPLALPLQILRGGGIRRGGGMDGL